MIFRRSTLKFYDFVKAPPSKQNAALTDGALSFVFVDHLYFVSFVKILI